VDGACPLIAFPTEFLRKEPSVRRAFEIVVRTMTDVFEQALQRNGGTARSRRHASAAWYWRAPSRIARSPTMGVALSLGQWPQRISTLEGIDRDSPAPFNRTEPATQNSRLG
jgi:TetR/AcrR family transcriptional regulator, transcriptional repressor for nem operon